jgi:hypothetical protein
MYLSDGEEKKVLMTLTSVTCIIKNIMIVNNTPTVVKMIPQLGPSLAIIILMTPEVSFMLPESSIMLLDNIYSTGVTVMIVTYNFHIFIAQATVFFFHPVIYHLQLSPCYLFLASQQVRFNKKYYTCNLRA